MDPEPTALLATAGTTLLNQLTSDVWEPAKAEFGALWRRVHPERRDTIETELTETRTVALRATHTGDEETLRGLADEWHSRLHRLIENDPDLVPDLRRWTSRWAPSPDSAGPTHVSMVATASGHGRITMAGRDIRLTES